MASEISQKLLDAIVQDEQYIGGIDDQRSREAIDAELQEAREAIGGVLRVADRKTVEFDRLRALYQRLQVKGVDE